MDKMDKDKKIVELHTESFEDDMVNAEVELFTQLGRLVDNFSHDLGEVQTLVTAMYGLMRMCLDVAPDTQQGKDFIKEAFEWALIEHARNDGV